VSAQDWIPNAFELLTRTKVLHRNYEATCRRLAAASLAIMKGELIVLVGPSRVGKTRCVRDALCIPEPNVPDQRSRMRVVVVEAGNDSTSGEFSTKAFMIECLRALHHPVYGVPDDDDPWQERLQARLRRTPEGTLRSAFQSGHELRETEYLVIDEAHHVGYTPGGDAAAARILDSYKCLANRTNLKLVLTGSYQLLRLLTLAPHLLGRQHPLEFPRYHGDVRSDVIAWQQILQTFSRCLRFENGQSLCSWNGYLFDGALGCVGQLLRWLRVALARSQSEGGISISRDLLEQTRLPAAQEVAILGEILAGEQQLVQANMPVSGRMPASLQDSDEAKPRASKPTRKQRNGKPFQRHSKRNTVGGRV